MGVPGMAGVALMVRVVEFLKVGEETVSGQL